MRRRAVGLLVGALVLTAVGAPAHAQSSAELARARQVLEDYWTCERSRQFTPCWRLLSKRVQSEWARQGRGSVAEYAEARGAAEPRYVDFRVLDIRRSPSRVVFVAEALRVGGADGRRDRIEYAVLREGEQWRIDGRRVGPSETTP
ncbi:MAG TPA: hypothetical protein VIF59_11330 [Methylomirabilota bacterium]|jgi:hypothetical protein